MVQPTTLYYNMSYCNISYYVIVYHILVEYTTLTCDDYAILWHG